MKSEKLSRRHFLQLAGAAAAGTVLGACQPQIVEVTKEVEVPVKETVVVEKEVEVPVKETVVVEKEVAAPAEEHSITVAWHTGGEGANAVFSRAVELFEEAFPNYTLEKVTAPWGPLYGETPGHVRVRHGARRAYHPLGLVRDIHREGWAAGH